MKLGSVHMTIEESETPRVVDSEEGLLPLLIVGEMVIGFATADTAERFARAAVEAAEKAHKSETGG